MSATEDSIIQQSGFETMVIVWTYRFEVSQVKRDSKVALQAFHYAGRLQVFRIFRFGLTSQGSLHAAVRRRDKGSQED